MDIETFRGRIKFIECYEIKYLADVNIRELGK